MTMYDNLIRRLQLLISVSILCFSGSVYSQSVVSISSEVLKDIAADELYWQVSVTCAGVDEARLMQQRAGEGSWCAVDMPQLCSDSKDSIAEQLCNDEYELLANTESNQSEADEASQEEIAETESEPEPVVEEPEQVIQAPEPVPEVVVEAPEPEWVVQEPEPEPVVQAPEPSPVVQEQRVVTTQAPTPVQQPLEVIQSEPIQNASTSTVAGSISLEEMAIEEELIRIEEEMLTLRLQEIELEQQTQQNSDE